MNDAWVKTFALIGGIGIVYGAIWLCQFIGESITYYIEKRRTRFNHEKYLNKVMNPKCTKCHDSGIVNGLTFDANDPCTYNDFFYCNCAVGVKYRLENLGDNH